MEIKVNYNSNLPIGAKTWYLKIFGLCCFSYGYFVHLFCLANGKCWLETETLSAKYKWKLSSALYDIKRTFGDIGFNNVGIEMQPHFGEKTWRSFLCKKIRYLLVPITTNTLVMSVLWDLLRREWKKWIKTAETQNIEIFSWRGTSGLSKQYRELYSTFRKNCVVITVRRRSETSIGSVGTPVAYSGKSPEVCNTGLCQQISQKNKSFMFFLLPFHRSIVLYNRQRRSKSGSMWL